MRSHHTKGMTNEYTGKINEGHNDNSTLNLSSGRQNKTATNADSDGM
jgi:hypothetical protein